jgi:hypothetical protein
VKSLACLICTASLAALGAAAMLAPSAPSVEPPAVPQYLTGSEAAESAWARALYEAVRSDGAAAGDARVLDAFGRALSCAERKAPIFLSLSAMDVGEWPCFTSVETLRRELDRRAGLLSPRLAEQAARSAPLHPLVDALVTTLHPLLEGGRSQPSDAASGELLVSRFVDPAALSVVCLEAAVADDPACIAAWQALALRGGPVRRREAAQAWQRLEPLNAAPVYLEAALLWDAAPAAAKQALRRADGLPRCEFPQPQLPMNFSAVIPRDEAVGALAGAPLTPAALSNLLRLHQGRRFAPRLEIELHRLAERLADPAVLGANAPETAVLLRRMGSRLVLCGTATADQVRRGLGILQVGAGAEQSVDSRLALSDYDFRLQRSTRELSAGVALWTARERELLEDRDALLSGEIDLCAEERAAMQALLSQPRLQAGLAVDAASR